MSDTLINRIRALDGIEKLSDGELIDAVVDEVYSELSLGSRQSALITTLLERFQKAIGLVETPHGITPDGEHGWPDVIGTSGKCFP